MTQPETATQQHAPGPWTLDNGHIVAPSDRWGQSTRTILIAKMEKHRPGSADRVSPDDVQAANARLILAAPDLLEAIRVLSEAIIPFNLCPLDTPGVAESRNAYLQAIVTITKAKGA